MRKIAYLILALLLLTVLTVPTLYGQIGPEMDVLRFTVIQSPDAKLIAMQTRIVDAWASMAVSMDAGSSLLAEAGGSLLRTADIEKLDADGYLVTADLGFHVGFIGYNLRADQSYRRGDVTYWPLADVNFRHALIHCYDQLGIIPPIYGYTVTPVRSLVPPAQSDYYNSNVTAHPYNPGSPLASTVWNPSTGANEDSCAILRYAGYTFVDTAPTGVVNDADYWEDPYGDPLPFMRIFTPLPTVAPTSWAHGQEFVADLSDIGLAATTGNGDAGMLAEGWDFNGYLELVYDWADFDAFMVFYGLGRVPAQLYAWLHSSQDCYTYPGRGNAVGVNDPTIDALTETVRFSLDLSTIAAAAKDVQAMLYAHTDLGLYPSADQYTLAYMTLYSRTYFNAFSPDLRGVVRSSGFGSDNKWTHLNLHWAPGTERLEDGKTVAIWMLDDDPDSFNPLYASTEHEWEILTQVYDGLTSINPYNHYDIPWMATDWTITEVGGGMDIDFTLRDDVYWQDGYLFDASDVEFCLEFLRDRQVPRYADTWETLSDVVVTDATHVTIEATDPGLALFYDYAGLGPLLPMQIWDRAWADDQAVLDYDPTAYSYGSDMAPGYSAGPWASEVLTNLFGTGPFRFLFYDPVNMYSDLWKNEHYFMTTAAIQDLKIEMFHDVGDVNRDGIINPIDVTLLALAYGTSIGDPGYDPDADLNDDGIIDIFDLLANGGGVVAHLGELRTYPGGGGGGGGSDSLSRLASESAGAVSHPVAEGAQEEATSATVYMVPAEIVDYALKTNDTFSVDIYVANVTDLMGSDLRLTFNSTILHVASFTAGDFFGAAPYLWHYNENNAAGFVRFALTSELGMKTGESGSGRLATIEFVVQAYGNSSLQLTGFTKLANSHGLSVDHTTSDGYFNNLHPADVNRDGSINVVDLTIVSFAYGAFAGEPRYNPDADINKDGIVDMKDLVIVAMNLMSI